MEVTREKYFAPLRFSRSRAENRNSMEQHRMFHVPRFVACPVCGEARFSSGGSYLSISEV